MAVVLVAVVMLACQLTHDSLADHPLDSAQFVVAAAAAHGSTNGGAKKRPVAILTLAGLQGLALVLRLSIGHVRSFALVARAIKFVGGHEDEMSKLFMMRLEEDTASIYTCPSHMHQPRAKVRRSRLTAWPREQPPRHWTYGLLVVIRCSGVVCSAVEVGLCSVQYRSACI